MQLHTFKAGETKSIDGAPMEVMIKAFKAINARRPGATMADLPFGMILIEDGIADERDERQFEFSANRRTWLGIQLERGTSTEIKRVNEKALRVGLTGSGVFRSTDAGGELDLGEALPSRYPPSFRAWLANGDRGLSSEAIAHRLFGFPVAPINAVVTPRDPSDFARCQKLLDSVPEAAERLDEMRSVSVKWAGLVDHWNSLARLYREEAPSGTAPKLYAALKALLEPSPGPDDDASVSSPGMATT